MEEIFSEDNWDFEREKGDNQTNKFSRSLSSPNPVPSQLVKCSSPLDELFIEAEELQQLSNQEEIDNKNNNNSLLNLDEEERRKRFKSCSTSHLDIPPPKEGGILRKFRFGSKQQLDQNNSAVDSSVLFFSLFYLFFFIISSYLFLSINFFFISLQLLS